MVGTSGSGKTALARRLAERLACPYIELDALHWNPNWISTPADEFRVRVTRALESDAWVVDGNYHAVRDVVWSQADTIVWLDYPLPLILWRLLHRTVRRVLTREVLWGGNRENLLTAVFSRDSIFLWAFRTYGTLRRTYSAIPGDPALAHLTLVRLRSPGSCAAWLSRVEITGGGRGGSRTHTADQARGF